MSHRSAALFAASRIATGLLVASFGFGAHAQTAWNEASQGDLSNDGLAPTAVTFAAGSNSVFGSAGDAGQGIDRDYFVFVVPEGMVLTRLMLLEGSSVSGGASFLALQAGPQLTVTPTGAGAENLLGFLHYSGDQVGTDLLPSLVFGFTGRLAAGTYSAWVQETGGPVRYGLDFVLTPVPEPATIGLMGVGLLGAALAGRRRRR